MSEGSRMLDVRPRVLIIDDEPMVRLTLVAFLEDCGFACLESGSAREGLDVFQREPPDLVLTDLQMEEMDGLAVVRALMLSDQRIPVIVMTGSEDPSIVRDVLDSGARHCFPKPIRDLRHLASAIHACLS